MNYLPFDLETALKHPERVVTRDGRKASEIHQFKTFPDHNVFFVIPESVISCSIDGKYTTSGSSGLDLFLLPEVKECWVNVYENDKEVGVTRPYHTKELAVSNLAPGYTYIKTIRITNEPE